MRRATHGGGMRSSNGICSISNYLTRRQPNQIQTTSQNTRCEKGKGPMFSMFNKWRFIQMGLIQTGVVDASRMA